MALPLGIVEGSTAMISVESDGIKIELEGVWTRAMCDAVNLEINSAAHKKELEERARAAKVKRLIQEEVDRSIAEAGVEVIIPEDQYNG